MLHNSVSQPGVEVLYVKVVEIYIFVCFQWALGPYSGGKTICEPPNVQVVKKIREVCNFHHLCTSTVRKECQKIEHITLYDFSNFYMLNDVDNKYLAFTNKQKFWLPQTRYFFF